MIPVVRRMIPGVTPSHIDAHNHFVDSVISSDHEISITDSGVVGDSQQHTLRDILLVSTVNEVGDTLTD